MILEKIVWKCKRCRGKSNAKCHMTRKVVSFGVISWPRGGEGRGVDIRQSIGIQRQPALPYAALCESIGWILVYLHFVRFLYAM